MRAATTVGILILLLSACATTRHKQSDEEQVVDRIYAAYNSRNFDEFMSFFATDVEIYRPPHTLWLSGADAVGRYYGPRFAADPNARGTSIARIAQGRYIVDRDHVTGSSTGGAGRTVVWIYEIADGKIRRAWVLP